MTNTLQRILLVLAALCPCIAVGCQERWNPDDQPLVLAKVAEFGMVREEGAERWTQIDEWVVTDGEGLRRMEDAWRIIAENEEVTSAKLGCPPTYVCEMEAVDGQQIAFSVFGCGDAVGTGRGLAHLSPGERDVLMSALAR